VANVGDRIRAYDFQPSVGRADRFVEGRVIARGPREHGVKMYTILADVDSYDATGDSGDDNRYSRVGSEVYVPMGLAWCEYDGRVVKLS
jgi:hypothetical protein